ncbi:PadR family transcriptional regulator [Salinactinospora qingdaonensis]|uniref:PadR family transcriptional regulator n=1 Tax=Salinactinospora qingdaonensis TaxID=702744 RepID=A0ABP7F850_9ACTN
MSASRARVLELAVLGALNEAPLHGYELRKHLNGELGAFRAFSYGSLYPCLRDLLRRGLVREVTGDPPSGRGRRSRIVYQLTPSGKAWLERLLAEPGPATLDDACFGVHFSLFCHTSSDVRLRILEGRRKRMQERLEWLRERVRTAAARGDDYGIELHRHGAESVEREMYWLDDLIVRERGRAGQAEMEGSATLQARPGAPPPADRSV